MGIIKTYLQFQKIRGFVDISECFHVLRLKSVGNWWGNLLLHLLSDDTNLIPLHLWWSITVWTWKSLHIFCTGLQIWNRWIVSNKMVSRKPWKVQIVLFMVWQTCRCRCRIYTAQKMKFSVKDFFSKCDQIRRILQIWSHLLEKS